MQLKLKSDSPTTKSRKPKSSRKGLQIFDNPEQEESLLIKSKKKLDEQVRVAKLKQNVQKELRRLQQKDELAIQKYKHKKRQFQGAKIRQQKYLADQKYKAWLFEQGQLQFERVKGQSQLKRYKSSQNLSEAKQAQLKAKKRQASKTKELLGKWKLEKTELSAELLELNRRKKQEIEDRKKKTKRDNEKLFELKHSRVEKECRSQIDLSESRSNVEIEQIQKLEGKLLSLRKKTSNRSEKIEKLEGDIRSIRNETTELSKSRLGMATSRLSMTDSSKIQGMGSSKSVNLGATKDSHRLSLPAIHGN